MGRERANELKKRAFDLRAQLNGTSGIEFCLELAAACREAGRAVLEAGEELYARSYERGNLSPRDREEMRNAAARAHKREVAAAYYGGPKPLDGARIWLARLHHWWQVHDRGGDPPAESWWRDSADVEIAAIVHDCERSLDKERDHDEPVYWGFAPALADWAGRQMRWVDDEVADLFALEMINGRPSPRDQATLVSGHRQHPEWLPTPTIWTQRLNSYRSRVWTPILGEDGDLETDWPDPHAPSTDDLAASMDEEEVRAAWHRVHLTTLARIPNDRAAVERYGAADAELVATPLDGVLQPKARNLGTGATQRKSRARAAYWQAFGPAAGFPSTHALVEALLGDAEHARFWRGTGMAYGPEAWQAMTAALAAPPETPQDAQQHRWLTRRRNDFVQWVIVLAWAAAFEIPRYEKEVTE